MTPPVAIIDTNVVVSGLLTSERAAPTVVLLEAMLQLLERPPGRAESCLRVDFSRCCATAREQGGVRRSGTQPPIELNSGTKIFAVAAGSCHHAAAVARNDQVMRLLQLVRLLESSHGLTLKQLADGLPDDFPKHLRTIRRDLIALEGFFPVMTDRVDGQTRWKLLDGFRRLPALSFSPSELMALVFSRDLLRPLQGTQVHAALDSALNKASAALPPSGLDLVRQMRDLLSVRFGPYKSYRAHRETIDRVTRAISDRRTVQIRYFSASTGKAGRREVDPYHLWYAAGGLYLIGYCHRRRDVRMFAVERVRALTITDHPYQLPLGFDVEAYVQDALVVMRGGRQIAVEVVFDRSTAAWARDRQWHPSQRLTQLRNGRLRMTLQVADTRELVGWLLSFGRGVKVVRPAELQDRVRREALALARQ